MARIKIDFENAVKKWWDAEVGDNAEVTSPIALNASQHEYSLHEISTRKRRAKKLYRRCVMPCSRLQGSVCGARVAPPRSRLDEDGRPFCEEHSATLSPDWKTFVDSQDETRRVVAKAVADGVLSRDEASEVYSGWDSGDLPDP